MNALEVRVIRLEPHRVASALGWGAQPENEAWALLMEWVKAQNWGEQVKQHRFFGFNNPSPSAGSPNYGYEQWVTVDSEATGAGKVQIKEFPGGLYAVLRCRGIPNPETWGKLVQWREASRYQCGHHQWLEECLDPSVPFEQLEFNLYLPVTE